MIDPTPDEARAALRRELLRPDYQDRDVVGRLIGALDRLVDRGLAAAAAASWVQTLAALVVLLLLVAGLARLVSRTRRAGALRPPSAAVLPGVAASADELRARAVAALEEGRVDDALVDGFRALARGEVEAGRLADDPGATATEIATAIAGGAAGAPADAVVASARAFDAVVYGRRPATSAQVRTVLDLGRPRPDAADRSLRDGLRTGRPVSRP